MTMKLYMNDPYIYAFKAVVLDVFPLENGEFGVVLDQTAFYPEGGGQLSDSGTIDDIPVPFVEIKDGIILHHMAMKIEKGQTVTCMIDQARRTRHMQAHLGQHLLSAAFKREFDAATVGFHMGDDYVTIDLDKRLGSVEIDRAEDLANQVIYKNVPVRALYPSQDDLEHLPLRKQPKVSENIRIIEVEGFDHSPCGGTHPNFTGEVGIIKIVNVANYKAGIRLEFLCGSLALENFRSKNDLLNQLASTLSVRWYEVQASVERLLGDIEQNHKTNGALKQKLFRFEAEKLKSSIMKKDTVSYVFHAFDDYSANEVKIISQLLGESEKVIRLLLSSELGKTTLLIEVPSDYAPLSAKELLAKVLAITGGRGGGSPTAAQGGPIVIDDIENIIHQII